MLTLFGSLQPAGTVPELINQTSTTPMLITAGLITAQLLTASQLTASTVEPGADARCVDLLSDLL